MGQNNGKTCSILHPEVLFKRDRKIPRNSLFRNLIAFHRDYNSLFYYIGKPEEVHRGSRSKRALFRTNDKQIWQFRSAEGIYPQ